MKEEPFFLINEFLGKDRNELEKVLNAVSVKNSKLNDKAIFLRNFTNELLKAHRKTKKNIIESNKQEADKTHKDKELLLKKKSDLLKKIKILQEEKKNIIPDIHVSEKKELILSKETGKTLVNTEFTGTNYNIKEPELNLQDHYVIDELKKTNANIEDKIKFSDAIKNLSGKYNINCDDHYIDKIRYYVVRDLKKYGKISALVEDKDVKEILCSGFNQPIIITYKDKQDITTNTIFESEDELNAFIHYLAAKISQKVSVENPFLNAIIDGMKLQASLGSEFIKPKFAISKI